MLRSLSIATALFLASSAAQAQSGAKFIEPDPIGLGQFVFSTMDVNLTSTVSQEELDFFFRFAFISSDLDDNGIISEAEFKESYPAMIPVEVMETEWGGDWIAQQLKAYDTDGQPGLTIEEMTARFQTGFDAADANSDQVLSLEEFNQLGFMIDLIALEHKAYGSVETPSTQG